MGMNPEKVLRKEEYVGKAYFIDLETSQIIGEGEGVFLVNQEKLFTHESSKEFGHYQRTVVVLEAGECCFMPEDIRERTLFGEMADSYSMSSFFYWPKTMGPLHFLGSFEVITIRTTGMQNGVAQTLGQKVATLTQKGEYKKLGKESFGNFNLDLRTMYSTSWGGENPHIDYYFQFIFTIQNHSLNWRDIFKVGWSFRLYWLLNFDYTDVEIKWLNLGGDLYYLPKVRVLKAFRSNVIEYQKYPHVDDDFHLQLFAKTSSFLFNLENKKEWGESSKVGLALSRITNHRYSRRDLSLESEAVNLIFALQAFLESLAQGTAKTLQKSSKGEIVEGIEKVLAQIESVKESLPLEVSQFYLKKPNEIYSLISRPTFQESVKKIFEELGISYAEYESLIKDIDQTRRQIVHSEGYNLEFLVNTLLSRGVVDIVADKNSTSMTFGHKEGGLDKLYTLTRRIALGFFKEMK